MAVNVHSKRFRFFQVDTYGDKRGQLKEIPVEEVFAALNGNGQVWFSDTHSTMIPQRVSVTVDDPSPVERFWFEGEIAKLDGGQT